jgi:hypothetical protein
MLWRFFVRMQAWKYTHVKQEVSSVTVDWYIPKTDAKLPCKCFCQQRRGWVASSWGYDGISVARASLLIPSLLLGTSFCKTLRMKLVFHG